MYSYSCRLNNCITQIDKDYSNNVERNFKVIIVIIKRLSESYNRQPPFAAALWEAFWKQDWMYIHWTCCLGGHAKFCGHWMYLNWTCCLENRDNVLWAAFTGHWLTCYAICLFWTVLGGHVSRISHYYRWSRRRLPTYIVWGARHTQLASLSQWPQISSQWVKQSSLYCCDFIRLSMGNSQWGSDMHLTVLFNAGSLTT